MSYQRKRDYEIVADATEHTTGRTHWVIDEEIPIFKGYGRKYIDDLVYVGD